MRTFEGSVADWLHSVRRQQLMRVAETTLDACPPWELRNGGIARPDSRFFRVVLHDDSLWIDQPEIGLLGFLLRDTSGGPQVLLHAKSEPGNAPIVQFAPSIQATRSNLERVHGGMGQLYLEYFETTGNGRSPETLQSEQGSRFWKKRNRNAVRVVDEAPETELIRWFDADEFLPCLSESGAVNTDARSVIASSRWTLWIPSGRTPFTNSPGSLRAAAVNSYAQEPTTAVEVLTELSALQEAAMGASAAFPDTPLSVLDLQQLSSGPGRQIIFVSVDAVGREVEHWCQPLICDARDRTHVLLLRIREHRLEVLLRLASEQGLFNGWEFTSSWDSDCAPTESEQLDGWVRSGAVLTRVRQSDEGGRFFHVMCDYELRVIPDSGNSIDTGQRWITLADLQMICMKPGATTNELRTLASMLLAWL